MGKHYYLLEVNSRNHIKIFLNLPLSLYKNNNNWIRPLDEDIEKVFDKKKNKLLRNGKVIRWILLDRDEKPIGRIAAFYDPKTAKKEDQLTGGTGFFECINDSVAAKLLFDAARN